MDDLEVVVMHRYNTPDGLRRATAGGREQGAPVAGRNDLERVRRWRQPNPVAARHLPGALPLQARS